MACALISCHKENSSPNQNLSLDTFAPLCVNEYRYNHDEISNLILQQIRREGRMMAADRRLAQFYSGNNGFMWIDRMGVDHRADTLLQTIKQAGRYGFNPSLFKADDIESDLQRVRTLDFDKGNNTISKVLARLEVNLSRAYFRYIVCQRYGIVNPDIIFNRIDTYLVDSTKHRFRRLSDLSARRPDSAFYAQSVMATRSDTLSLYLKSMVPHGFLHDKLVGALAVAHSNAQRLKLICNIERCRWRTALNVENHDKYVIVNIPSFTLRATDSDKHIDMRVACGTLSTKTPLLISYLKRMDVNPQWIVPKSIARDIVGNHSYMHRMGMFIYDKKLGKLTPEEGSYAKVMAGDQYVIQAGGPKNSLGRIIFRFDNNFSVYLHDTSSPWLFKKSFRAVSHGCVRVERPLELALFLAGNRGDKLMDKLRYSMTVPLINEDGSVNSNINRKKLINNVHLKPFIPLFITYYTMFTDSYGNLSDYPDVYGYDKVLADKLLPFVK